jgi:hypothetical protein
MRLIAADLTTPWAIVIAGAIIGLAVIVGEFITPYQISAGPPNVWRLNRLTGAMVHCGVQNSGGQLTTQCLAPASP